MCVPPTLGLKQLDGSSILVQGLRVLSCSEQLVTLILESLHMTRKRGWVWSSWRRRGWSSWMWYGIISGCGHVSGGWFTGGGSAISLMGNSCLFNLINLDPAASLLLIFLPSNL